MPTSDKVGGVLADLRGYWANSRRGSWHRFIKKQKARLERRRAKRHPECAPAYGKYNGYES